jgi:pre-rRNA-processing protein TSR3
MNKRDKRDTKHKSEKKAKVRDSSPEEERFPAENEEEKENPPPENETNDEKISLFMVDFNQCDPSKCSGRKLESFGLLKNINHKGRFRGITLAATGKKYVSKEDKEIILKHGLCVIDCSWNKIE